MVGEFPSLQGVMGRVYALHDGEKPAVAQAIEEHYMPLRAGGEVPHSLLGAFVGIADRLDTLVGYFAIGEKPTGNKDVFGLRRQAIGLISIVRERDLTVPLHEFVTAALSGYGDTIPQDGKVADEVIAFIRHRFENDLIASGYAQEVVEAATAARFDEPIDCLKRVEALREIHGQDSFGVLAGSFKRINNIIKDSKETGIDEALLTEPAEQALYAAFVSTRDKALPLLDQRMYHEALLAMLAIKEPVDRFFDTVMVMVEADDVRTNRLNLLSALRGLVLRVGDISRMHVE